MGKSSGDKSASLCHQWQQRFPGELSQVILSTECHNPRDKNVLWSKRPHSINANAFKISIMSCMACVTHKYEGRVSSLSTSNRAYELRVKSPDLSRAN